MPQVITFGLRRDLMSREYIDGCSLCGFKSQGHSSGWFYLKLSGLTSLANDIDRMCTHSKKEVLTKKEIASE